MLRDSDIILIDSNKIRANRVKILLVRYIDIDRVKLFFNYKKALEHILSREPLAVITGNTAINEFHDLLYCINHYNQEQSKISTYPVLLYGTTDNSFDLDANYSKYAHDFSVINTPITKNQVLYIIQIIDHFQKRIQIKKEAIRK